MTNTELPVLNKSRKHILQLQCEVLVEHRSPLLPGSHVLLASAPKWPKPKLHLATKEVSGKSAPVSPGKGRNEQPRCCREW